MPSVSIPTPHRRSPQCRKPGSNASLGVCGFGLDWWLSRRRIEETACQKCLLDHTAPSPLRVQAVPQIQFGWRARHPLSLSLIPTLSAPSEVHRSRPFTARHPFTARQTNLQRRVCEHPIGPEIHRVSDGVGVQVVINAGAHDCAVEQALGPQVDERRDNQSQIPRIGAERREIESERKCAPGLAAVADLPAPRCIPWDVGLVRVGRIVHVFQHDLSCVVCVSAACGAMKRLLVQPQNQSIDGAERLRRSKCRLAPPHQFDFRDSRVGARHMWY